MADNLKVGEKVAKIDKPLLTGRISAIAADQKYATVVWDNDTYGPAVRTDQLVRHFEETTICGARLGNEICALPKGHVGMHDSAPWPEYRKYLFGLIDAERNRQDAKWGEQNHDDFVWGAILGEEIGEVHQAALHERYGDEHRGSLTEELTQAAAVIVSWLEAINRRHK